MTILRSAEEKTSFHVWRNYVCHHPSLHALWEIDFSLSVRVCYRGRSHHDYHSEDFFTTPCRSWCCGLSPAYANGSHHPQGFRRCSHTWKRLIPGAGHARCRAHQSPLSTMGGSSFGLCPRRVSTASQRAAPKQQTGSTGAISQHVASVCVLCTSPAYMFA